MPPLPHPPPLQLSALSPFRILSRSRTTPLRCRRGSRRTPFIFTLILSYLNSLALASSSMTFTRLSYCPRPRALSLNSLLSVIHPLFVSGEPDKALVA